MKREIAITGYSRADIIPDFRQGSAQNPVITVKRLCSQSAQNPFRNLATTNMWTEMRGAARCQSPEIRALCPSLIYPRTPGCFRKLNNGTPSQKRFWKGVVLFTPVRRRGVNDKIGLWRPKLRFKFQRCPVGAGQDEDGPGVTLNCGLSFGKGPNAFWGRTAICPSGGVDARVFVNGRGP